MSRYLVISAALCLRSGFNCSVCCSVTVNEISRETWPPPWIKMQCSNYTRVYLFKNATYEQKTWERYRGTEAINAGQSFFRNWVTYFILSRFRINLFRLCRSGHHFYENSTSGLFSFLKRWSHRQHIDKRIAERQTINCRQATLASGFSVIK